MKQRNLVSFFLGALLALTINPARAAYWTGAAADNNFWNAANWSGTAPNPAGATTESLFMTNAVGVTGTNTDLTLAEGVSFTLVNSTLEFVDTVTSPTNSKSIIGVAGGTANSVVFDNSTVTLQGVSVGIAVQLLNGSALILKGPGRPINTTTEQSSVTMGVGTSITFPNGCPIPMALLLPRLRRDALLDRAFSTRRASKATPPTH